MLAGHQMTEKRTGRRRSGTSIVIGFAAGALVVGVPLSIIVATLIFDSPLVWAVLMFGSGLMGAIYGDSFVERAADSNWWAAVRGFFRHWWI
jgi:hypothetical protein